MFIFLFTFFLAFTISASPLGPQSQAGSIILPNLPSNQSLLSVGDERWGPDEFSVVSNLRPTVLHGGFMLTTAVKAVSQLANGDFEGDIPEPGVRFRFDECPGMEISIVGVRNTRLKTKYALWGMARAANSVIKSGFRGGLFALKWKEQNVGSIWFIATVGTIDGSNATASNATASITGSMGSLGSPVIVPGLRWQFTKKDIIPDEMTLLHVAMGAIGAMNQIAPQTGSINSHWIGSFLPDYKALNIFNLMRGQQLTKAIVIATLVAEYSYMQYNSYFKALNTQIILNDRTIAEAIVMVQEIPGNSPVAVS